MDSEVTAPDLTARLKREAQYHPGTVDGLNYVGRLLLESAATIASLRSQVEALKEAEKQARRQAITECADAVRWLHGNGGYGTPGMEPNPSGPWLRRVEVYDALRALLTSPGAPK